MDGSQLVVAVLSYFFAPSFSFVIALAKYSFWG